MKNLSSGFMHKLPAVLLCIACSTCFISGCGPSVATVSGSVTLDGKPMDKGYITYAPAEGEGEAITADIRDGKYTLQVMPGKKFVQLSSPMVIGTRKDSDAPDAVLLEITEERLDERYYNSRDLTFDVQPGVNAKDWAVESKKKK